MTVVQLQQASHLGDVSITTIKKALHEKGLGSYREQWKFILNEHQEEKSGAWAPLWVLPQAPLAPCLPWDLVCKRYSTPPRLWQYSCRHLITCWSPRVPQEASLYTSASTSTPEGITLHLGLWKYSWRYHIICWAP